MSQTLQLKRETASWWTTNDPTLAAGEPGFETDTGRVKIGDGSTAWTALDYASSWPLSQAIAIGATTPVPGGVGARRWSTTTGSELVWDGTRWIVPREGVQRVLLASSVTNSTTTLADVTGLSFAVLAGVTYDFWFNIRYESAANTTGLGLSMNGPAGVLLHNHIIPTSGTGQIGGFRRGPNSETVAASSPGATPLDYLAVVYGVCIPSEDGTLIVRFRSEVAGSDVTIREGASGRLGTFWG